jgi:hypothetical protein
MTAQEIDHDYEAWLCDQADELDAQMEMDAARDAYFDMMRDEALAAAPPALPPTEEEILAMCKAAGLDEIPF